MVYSSFSIKITKTEMCAAWKSAKTVSVCRREGNAVMTSLWGSRDCGTSANDARKTVPADWLGGTSTSYNRSPVYKYRQRWLGDISIDVISIGVIPANDRQVLGQPAVWRHMDVFQTTGSDTSIGLIHKIHSEITTLLYCTCSTSLRQKIMKNNKIKN